MKSKNCLTSVGAQDIICSVEVGNLVYPEQGELGAVHAHEEKCKRHYVQELEPRIDFDTAQDLLAGKILGSHSRIPFADLHIRDQKGKTTVEDPRAGEHNACDWLEVEAA